MSTNFFLLLLFLAAAPQQEKGYDYLKVTNDITALRIDPEHFNFEIANVGDDYSMNAKQWSENKGYLTVTNAGMFDVYNLPVGMSKINGKIIKKHNVSTYKMAFVIGEKPELIDLENENFDKDKYHSYIQSIRMISSDGRNVWAKQAKKWSTACIAQDDQGMILFIHSRAPYPVHDFINELKKSDLNIVKAMYLEGGPEASLYINLPGLQAEHIGSYETGFWEDDSNEEFWNLPNIIGIKAK